MHRRAHSPRSQQSSSERGPGRRPSTGRLRNRRRVATSTGLGRRQSDSGPRPGSTGPSEPSVANMAQPLDAGPGSLTKTRVAARDRAQARVPGTDPLCDQSSRCEARHVCCAQRTLEPACVRIPFADAKGAQRPGAARPLAHQLHAGWTSGVGGSSYFSTCWSCMTASWF